MRESLSLIKGADSTGLPVFRPDNDHAWSIVSQDLCEVQFVPHISSEEKSYILQPGLVYNGGHPLALILWQPNILQPGLRL